MCEVWGVAGSILENKLGFGAPLECVGGGVISLVFGVWQGMGRGGGFGCRKN